MDSSNMYLSADGKKLVLVTNGVPEVFLSVNSPTVVPETDASAAEEAAGGGIEEVVAPARHGKAKENARFAGAKKDKEKTCGKCGKTGHTGWHCPKDSGLPPEADPAPDAGQAEEELLDEEPSGPSDADLEDVKDEDDAEPAGRPAPESAVAAAEMSDDDLRVLIKEYRMQGKDSLWIAAKLRIRMKRVQELWEPIGT